ncbi:MULTISPECIES: hypothetical protein [unclassified Pseudomonas]|uniref:hypothetical protein n=1 Tax=unclassified Pseudomonas TaxID=196821 RepID=UPI001032D9B6|nr:MULTISPECIES: hypothetical protein [unclassified Pseudomonas]
MTKDELRTELLRQVQHFQEIEGGELKTYAAQLPPDRKTWKKKPSEQAQLFQKEFAEAERS